MKKPPKIKMRHTDVSDHTISLPGIRAMLLVHFLMLNPEATLPVLAETRLYSNPHGYHMALSALKKHGLVIEREWEIGESTFSASEKGYQEINLIAEFQNWTRIKQTSCNT